MDKKHVTKAALTEMVADSESPKSEDRKCCSCCTCDCESCK